MGTKDTVNALAALNSIFGTVANIHMQDKQIKMQREQYQDNMQMQKEQLAMQKDQIQFERTVARHDSNQRMVADYGAANINVGGEDELWTLKAEIDPNVTPEGIALSHKRATDAGWDKGSPLTEAEYLNEYNRWVDKGQSSLLEDQYMRQAQIQAWETGGMELSEAETIKRLADEDVFPWTVDEFDLAGQKKALTSFGIFNPSAPIATEDRATLVQMGFLAENEDPREIQGYIAELRWKGYTNGKRAIPGFGVADPVASKAQMMALEASVYNHPDVQKSAIKSDNATKNLIRAFYPEALWGAEGDVDLGKDKFNFRNKSEHKVLFNLIQSYGTNPELLAETLASSNWYGSLGNPNMSSNGKAASLRDEESGEIFISRLVQDAVKSYYGAQSQLENIRNNLNGGMKAPISRKSSIGAWFKREKIWDAFGEGMSEQDRMLALKKVQLKDKEYGGTGYMDFLRKEGKLVQAMTALKGL